MFNCKFSFHVKKPFLARNVFSVFKVGLIPLKLSVLCVPTYHPVFICQFSIFLIVPVLNTIC